VYFIDRQLSGAEERRAEGPVVFRPSQRVIYAGRVRPGLGEAVLLAPAAPPKGLILLDHFQSPKRADPGVPGAFITDPVAQMRVSDLNPGFIDANDNLIMDTSSSGLQTCLQKLITTQFQNYLSHKSNTAPSAGDRLRVALVDLTGDKISKPDFAGWGSTVPMYAASVAKILAVYAAHQLRKDLRHLAATQAVSTGSALETAAHQRWSLKGDRPNLVWLFDIRNWSGTPNTLEFTAAARKALAGIMHNADAASLIVRIGFPYLASVAWQSGLFHPTRGGLWLTSSYSGVRWNANPVKGVQSANITALSAATYFTLLAQGRLADDAASAGMRTVLRHGCVTGLFPQGLGAVASKCGIWSDYLHDCVLVVRNAIRYVVVGLTRTDASEYSQYTQLFRELDNLIVRNNQTPRPVC
jgi:hypothetical protein